jgi:hypothetical protein
MLSDGITIENHFAPDAGDRLYRFSGGTYRHYAERYIRQRVKELCEAWGKADKWSSHKANEVAEYHPGRRAGAVGASSGGRG